MDIPGLLDLTNNILGLSALAVTAAVGVLAYLKRSVWIERFLSRGPAKRAARFEKVRDQVNARYAGSAELLAIRTDGMPRTEAVDSGFSSADWLANTSVRNAAAKLLAGLKLNAPHAIAVGGQHRHGGSPVRYAATDFAHVTAARDAGVKPAVLSAGAIVFCPADRTVLLQHRSGEVATYPHAIHILGGNYEPQRALHKYDDIDADPLRFCALREVREESGLSGLETRRAAVLVSEELTTGFVQFVYAALAVRQADCGSVLNSPEGGVRWVGLTELERLLADAHSLQVVPSGAALLLAWLGLGAPDQSGATPMGREARALFARITTG